MMVPDVTISVVRVGKVVVPLPSYQSDGAAGMDLHAALEAPMTLPPLGRAKIPTGLQMAIPEQFEGQIRPRSGLAAKRGITVLNTPGTVDSDYRGEVLVLLVNLSDQPAVVEPLERIAQIVFAPVGRAELRLVEELAPTSRGAGGYGSTGT